MNYKVELNNGKIFEITEEQYKESGWIDKMNDPKVIFIELAGGSYNKHRISEIVPIMGNDKVV